MPTNRVWRLMKRPDGEITDGVLDLVDETIPKPDHGQFLFRLNYLSLDPTNRAWMNPQPTYLPAVALGDPMRGIVCGTVLDSQHPDFVAGDIVSGLGQWADYQIGRPDALNKLEPGQLPLADAFGIFAVVGPTAYFGLLDIGQPQPGETVVVSAAAGATGSIVGQIAKIKGCRAVGLAGTDEKCRWIRDTLGFDACINYRTENISQSLAQHCPDGIDIYFDNVGGKTLDAALGLLNLNARVPFCGFISRYNAKESLPGPYNYPYILMKRARVQGFIVLDYLDRYPEAISALAKWIAAGKIKYRLHIVNGLENADTTLRKLFTGEHNGKLMVCVSDPELPLTSPPPQR